MVNQNKIFSFKIKRQAKNVFPRDVERTVRKISVLHCIWLKKAPYLEQCLTWTCYGNSLGSLLSHFLVKRFRKNGVNKKVLLTFYLDLFCFTDGCRGSNDQQHKGYEGPHLLCVSWGYQVSQPMGWSAGVPAYCTTQEKGIYVVCWLRKRRPRWDFGSVQSDQGFSLFINIQSNLCKESTKRKDKMWFLKTGACLIQGEIILDF